MTRKVLFSLFLMISVLSLAVPGFGEEAEQMSRITVADTKEDAISQPGSVDVIAGEELEDKLYGVDDIHRVLRQVPGVNIQEEEGYGLRPNIGFRGVPNERSGRITLMEDGILIAPAPYSAPSAYYFPAVGRMEGIEITKGPGQIKYGPYTTGGALNLLTTSIPEDEQAEAKLGVGSDDLLKAHVNAGKSWKHGGFLLETYQFYTDGFKDLDGGGDTGTDLQDYQLKGRLNTDPDDPYYQQIEYKFGKYDQDSNETYLGLTDEDFGDTPFRRYSGSQLDNIQVDHTQNHLWHYIELTPEINLKTAFYLNDTDRNWQKLEKVAGTGIASILNSPDEFSTELASIKGADSGEGDFAIRQNQRTYYSKGIQSTFSSDFELGGMDHELEAGARFHSDREDRFQREDNFTMANGTLVLDELGEPGSQANRVGSANAWAFYVQDIIRVEDFTLTPGLRWERINYKREDYGKNDPTRSGVDLTRTDSDVSAIIPGGSVQYEFLEGANVFAGIHKGFSPPGPQKSDEVKEEESINYELGSSYIEDSLYAKAVFFYTDYDNLLGADTLSSGGTGSGDLFNGGEVDVIGLELSAGYDIMESMDAEFAIPIKFSYTFTDAEFASSFESDFFGDVDDGDQVPYIPEHQGYASIGVEVENCGVYFETYFTDSMKTAAGEVGFPDETDSYTVFNLLGRYIVNDNVSAYVSLDNLFDREYVVARRPAGARPGLPFTVVGGVELKI